MNQIVKTITLGIAFAITTSMTSAEESPKDLGYTFPDEWEEHAGTMMIFPGYHSYGRKSEGLRDEFAEVAAQIAENEHVVVFCLPEEEKDCEEFMEGIPNLTIHTGDYRIDWARDNAPMVIVDEEGNLASAGFRFNGWGKKYKGWQDDADTRDNIARKMGWPIFHSDFVLEGGSIEIGAGVGIVTESCVIHRNRTDWSKTKVEEELMKMLGLDQIIWLKSGLMPDKTTDGHADGIVKFIAEDTVMLHTTDLKSDINYAICRDAKRTLLEAGLKVVELPLMDDIVHMNFYIGSGGDIAYVPICGDPEQDDPALEIIEKYYDEVIPIYSVNIAEAGGGIHCYTQQIPSTK